MDLYSAFFSSWAFALEIFCFAVSISASLFLMIFLVMAEENLSAEVSTQSLQKIVLIKDFLQISFIDQKENYSYNITSK